MAYSSRFSFWRQKVEVETKPASDSDGEEAETETSGDPQPLTSSTRSDSVMGGPDPPAASSRQESTEDQGPTRKKGVKVIRRVVRRVVPGVEEQPQAPSTEPPKAAPIATSVPKTAPLSGKKDEKDDISMGLASLMGRGRTKDHRPRTRTQDRKEDKEEEKEQEEEKEVESQEPPAVKEDEAPSTSVSTPAPPTPAPPKSNPTIPPTGFIPTPAPKANPLAPPPGFIPAPKTKVNPLAPPPGFIPAPVPKNNLFAPPPGFIPAPRQNPLARPPGFIPAPKSDPLAPPPGFVPAPRSWAVKKPETQLDQDPVALLQAAHTAASQPKVKTEEQIAAEKAWYGTEKVWLVHKDGFSLATLLKTEPGSLPEGKVKIRLESDGSLLDVDEDDVEKANPPLFDRVEDLSSLQYLNESSVMHSLRQRYGGNLIHTHAGPNMVVINPISAPSMYSEKVMHMFKGCRREDTAPHIYGVAQSAYRNLLTTRQDQSIVLLGKSGSGKTINCQHLVQYLVTIAGSTGKTFSAEKWQAVYTILEAFGNSSTSMNGNASRFSHIVSLDFDQAGQVASASIQTMLLEKLRVTRRPEGESTFNVFYYMMAGADSSLKTELHFNHFAENSAFGIMPQPKSEDKQRASQQFTKLQAAMKVLGISGEEQRAFWLVLGAIYHLGAAGATKVSVIEEIDEEKAGRKQFARHEWAQKAAYLLGCTLEELSSSIFKHQAKGTLPRASTIRQGTDDAAGEASGSKATAMECLEAMASGLYSELFTLLVSLINRALKSSQHSLCSLLIVDTPGFQNPRLAKRERGATFEELCHNYTQERLQTLFYQRTFVQELERYKEENIELPLDDMEPNTSLSVAAVDQASSQALVRTLRTDEARGLLWLMEEEALQPGGSEDTLLGRLFSYYGPAEGESKGHTLLLKSERLHHFLLGHSHGTDWVEYDARGWLSHAKQNPVSTNAGSLLQDSQKKNISGLFMSRGGGATILSGSIAGLEGVSQLTLRRATSMRKTFTTGVAAVKKKSLCIQIKLQVDALLDTVRRSRVHFVHCLLPNADALRAGRGELEAQGESGDSGLMQLDVALLRSQLRGSKLLDALRIYRQGYPDHMVFSEFRRRFDVLAPHLTKKLGRNYIVKDEKRAVEELLESLDLEKSSYHMGLSRLFFRAGTLAKLEEQRDEQTRHNITLFQAACSGYLARQAFKKRKTHDLAIRCIQKNIKKNKGVKGWPWWKLFTTVRPLIEVQLTEEQIRGKDEEIQHLKGKLEKTEKERNELRLNSDRLESRITELSAELADERNTGESASQLLETETSERLRLEKDMKDLQAKFDLMKKQMECMEMEVMEARLIRTAELNGDMDDDDDDAGGEWRLKYDRAIRETEFTKKRLQQEFEDKLETEQQNKRHLERRLTDLQADSDEVQRSVQQLKKKCSRLTAELQDTKLHLEGQQSRNHDLEKKQRKFDLEQSQAQDEVLREKNLREKLGRERDMMTGELFSLRQQLQDKDMELCAVQLKVEQLDAELQDLSSQESKDEASLSKTKKTLRDLEAKVKDQEEELDEQAGTIQMLEQAKLRLEMEMVSLRQTHSKDIESKDEEVEEIRQSCSKKLKQMEVQLEEEYDDKQKVLRERRELETKLLSAQDQVGCRDVETEKRLRKDLKRTKVLLADAQIMLDHMKNNAPSKRETAQLKNQLEESEFTCAAAVKSRKGMEIEIEDLHIQMEDVVKVKMSLEEQVSRLQREKNDLQSRMEEDQEDMNELMKKHKAAVSQSARDLAQISDLQAQLEEAMKEKQEIQDKLQSLQSQLEFQEQSMVEKSLVSRQEAKIRELETKLEYERTQIKRLESLTGRLKENLEKMTEERDHRANGENREKEQNKRIQRQMRDIKEEMAELSKKEAEASRKKHELEMDIESLEAANQSLQADLKLAFKRIGDLQAAIEDEMVDSDGDDDLVNNLQDMVTKYQKRKNKTGDESDTDSEVEDRVDGVKSWLSKNKGSTKTLSDEGSLKSSRYAVNVDANEGKEVKEIKEGSKEGKESKEVDSRSVSVMSSLSYRKRSNLKDSIGGQGDESSLFSTLKEQSDTPDRSSLRKAKSKSTDQDDRKKSQDDDDDRGSVISQAYSEATSRARKGLERRWAPHSPDFDKDSMVSSLAPSRSSRRAMPNMDDDNMSTISSITSVSRTSPRGLRRSTSWKDDGRSDSYGTSVSPSMSRRTGGRSPGSVSKADSRISVARSSRLSEFGLRMDDDDDALSMAFSQGTSAYSPHSLGRSFSTPAQPRSSDDKPPDTSDIKAVTHRNYLDPDLEKAINEVLSFKPIKFKRSKLDESDDEEENEEKKNEDDRNSVKGDDKGLGRSASSVRRSASGSAVDYSTRSSSSFSSSSSRRGKAKKKSSSDSSSDSDDRHSRKSSKKKGKKSRKGSRKKESESESSSSESSSSSSSASTGSYRSSNSVKRGPARPASDEEEVTEQRPPSKKDEKKKKKKMDSMVMKYLYKPDSD
ncbi:unconventional myosin-XVIIIa isoform X7 [Salmo trutta]|uniref:unconventional myosin-XVIIIa isoform X7 n=1 Tax=Salmo trutta TaxID=8032 RepID=UPI001131EC53|nr:unconventional myosin-XVIIIa-like isoform X7 [Salmo trutta]